MTLDTNKGITAVSYNQLNLPTKVSFGATKNITYIYDALGIKLEKVVNDNGTITTTDYAGGFIYENNQLQFFNQPEGYVEANASSFNYVYQYKDHLGNIRLNYWKNPISGVLEIKEENNYYPFGLKHKGYNSNIIKEHKYKYNGKELQQELGLNMYDYGARNYDPALGRWFVIDAFAEKAPGITPYRYAFNNPISIIDPDGNQENEPCDIGGNCNSNNGKFGYYELGPGASLNADGSVSGSIKGSGDPVKGAAGTTRNNNDGTTTVTVGQISYTTKALPKVGGESRDTDGNSSLGFGDFSFIPAVASETFYSKITETWLGKNFKRYSFDWGGNGSTGGKFKFAKNLSKAFTGVGYGLGVLNAYTTNEKFQSGEIGVFERNLEQSSNLISTFGGIAGAAWSIGWETGRYITKLPGYDKNIRQPLLRTLNFIPPEQPECFTCSLFLKN